MKKIYLMFILVSTLLSITCQKGFAIDLQILGGAYNEVEYSGYPKNGTYHLEVIKDNYTFQPDQFEINISLPTQGAYDPTRAAEVVLPTGWELIITSNTSLILRATAPYEGSGATQNRKRDFYIPTIATGAAVDQPTMVTIEWKDFEVTENPNANKAGYVLNVIANPLPVVLIDFVLTKENNTTNLSWTTSEESNSDRFDVQHSVNATNWTMIGSVKSSGESTANKDYRYVHTSPADGVNYYRLKMLDKDGTFAYSNIRTVSFDNGVTTNVYPNPSSDKVFISISDWNKVNSVQILNSAGLSVHNSKTMTSSEIDVRNLATGIYIVTIKKTDGSAVTKRFAVVR